MASSVTSKLKSWVTIDDAYTTDGKVVVCQVCDKKVGCSMKSQLEQHIKTALHQKNKELQCPKKQVLLTQMQPASENISEFFKDLSRAFIAADIPWYRLQVPELSSFLEKYCKRKIPDESTLRKKYLDVCYEDAIRRIRDEVGVSHIWLAVDETTDTLGRYVANLVVGKLDPDSPSRSFLISSKVLEKTNHSTVARFVNDGLKVLWPESVPAEKVLVMCSDAAAYMLKAAVALKVFYPNLIHMSCLAHGLHRVAEEVRGSFPKVNVLVSSTKKVFVKAPIRVQCYRDALPNVPLPPEPVLTRWGTWIQAVEFYNENFDAVKSVVTSFPAESGAAVRESQNAFNEPGVECSLSYIVSNFGWIAKSIKKLETPGLSLKESMNIIEDAEMKLNTVQGETGMKIVQKFQSVLKRNPGYATFKTVCRILDGEETEVPENISPGKCHLLKYAPVTSCDVERSFSTYKRILTDRRLNMTPEHLEKYLVVHCASH